MITPLTQVLGGKVTIKRESYSLLMPFIRTHKYEIWVSIPIIITFYMPMQLMHLHVEWRQKSARDSWHLLAITRNQVRERHANLHFHLITFNRRDHKFSKNMDQIWPQSKDLLQSKGQAPDDITTRRWYYNALVSIKVNLLPIFEIQCYLRVRWCIDVSDYRCNGKKPSTPP